MLCVVLHGPILSYRSTTKPNSVARSIHDPMPRKATCNFCNQRLEARRIIARRCVTLLDFDQGLVALFQGASRIHGRA